MKIEKVNDHQIRCTLTKEDLADRELKLSELAYGSQKAKDLFRDMMQQASYEFGFEADDIPLMIEAVPLNSECIVLIITKVEDPEELDTRFSKFAPSVHEESHSDESAADVLAEGADDVLDLFRKIQNRAEKPKAVPTKEEIKEVLRKKPSDEPVELTKLFIFSSLHEIIQLSHVLVNYYHGENSLYRQKDRSYVLVLSGKGHTPLEFNKVCNILSEYGSPAKSIPAAESYLEEHFDPIIKGDALQSLFSV